MGITSQGTATGMTNRHLASIQNPAAHSCIVQVTLRLAQIPGNVHVLIFVVNVYSLNRVFRDVDNEFCRLIDARTHAELCRFEMDYMDAQVSRKYMCNTCNMCTACLTMPYTGD